MSDGFASFLGNNRRGLKLSGIDPFVGELTTKVTKRAKVEAPA